VAQIADTAATARRREIAFARLPDDARAHAGSAARLPALDAVALERWRALGGCAVEPNGYFLAEWELAVHAFSPGRTGARALAAEGDAGAGLIGLLPVVSAWRAPFACRCRRWSAPTRSARWRRRCWIAIGRTAPRTD